MEADRFLDKMLSDLERHRGERARKTSPAPWIHEDLQRLEPPADVSAGKTFPGPLLDDAHKPSSHRRAMKGKTVLKALFPRRSSGSVPASAAGREEMPGTVTGDEHALTFPQVAWLPGDLQRLEPPALTDVSAGKTFLNPLVDAAHKPSSHGRGSLRRKNKQIGNSESLEASNLLDKMLSDLERRHEMEGEAVLKTEFPRGSSGSVPASAARREAMSGTVTGGPPGWSNPDIGDKKSLEADRLLDKMLSNLERRRVMKGKTVLKALFPRRSSRSVPTSAAGSEEMPGTVTGDERAWKVSQVAWLHGGLQRLEPPAVTDVSAGKTFLNPLVDAAHKPSSHRRGSLRRKNKQIGNSESLEASDLLEQTLGDLERRRGMDREPLWKVAFPEGRRAMPGPGTGDEPVGEGDLASKPTFRTEPLGDGEVMGQKSVPKEAFPRGSSGVVPASSAGGTAMPGTGTGTETGRGDAPGTSTHVPDFQKEDGKGFCQDTRCWLELIAFLVVLELVFMLCCIGTWYWWKRKWCARVASQDQTKPSVEDTIACHQPSSRQCPLALLQLPYQLVAMDMLPPPRTRPSVPKGAGRGVRPGLKATLSF